MQRYLLHAVLSTVAAVGLLVIGGVMYQRFGVDLYTIGFVGLGLLSLYRTIPPLLLPDRFTRPQISRGRLLVDVVGIVFVGLALYLFVFERTDLLSQISL